MHQTQNRSDRMSSSATNFRHGVGVACWFYISTSTFVFSNNSISLSSVISSQNTEKKSRDCDGKVCIVFWWRFLRNRSWRFCNYINIPIVQTNKPMAHRHTQNIRVSTNVSVSPLLIQPNQRSASANTHTHGIRNTERMSSKYRRNILCSIGIYRISAWAYTCGRACSKHVFRKAARRVSSASVFRRPKQIAYIAYIARKRVSVACVNVSRGGWRWWVHHLVGLSLQCTHRVFLKHKHVSASLVTTNVPLIYFFAFSLSLVLFRCVSRVCRCWVVCVSCVLSVPLPFQIDYGTQIGIQFRGSNFPSVRKTYKFGV